MCVCKILQARVICKAVLLMLCAVSTISPIELKDMFLWVTPEGPQPCTGSCQRARNTERQREREREREHVPQQLNISICSLLCVKYMLIYEGLTELMINKTSSGFRTLLLQRNYFFQGPKKKNHSCYCEWREIWKDFCPVYFSLVRCQSSDIRQIPPWRSDPTCLTDGGFSRIPSQQRWGGGDGSLHVDIAGDKLLSLVNNITAAGADEVMNVLSWFNSSIRLIAAGL